VSGDEKNGFRIDSLPAEFGIALTQEAFRQYYTPYNAYYYVNIGQASADSMIPVPVYVRSALSDQDAATQLTGSLLLGAPAQFEGVAQTAVNRIQVAGINITQNGVAQVTLKPQSVCTAPAHLPCSKLADELLATFAGLGSISEVEVTDQALGPQVSLGDSHNINAVMQTYHITVNTQKQNAADLYYIDPATAKDDPAAGRLLVRLAGKASDPVLAGPADRKYGQVAVGTDPSTRQTMLALTDPSDSNLYLVEPGSTQPPASLFTGSDIKSLSWDAFGHLWFIAAIGGQETLFRVDASGGTPQVHQATAQMGSEDGPIQHVSAAPDGRRVAVVYADSTGVLKLSISVEHSIGPRIYLDLADGAGQEIAAGWSSISDVEWNSSQTLAILGNEQSTAAPTISEVYTDGSPVFTQPDLNPVVISPPVGATSIAWTATGVLVAAYGAGSAHTPQIAFYSTATGAWENAFSGISPSFAY
jgi:hypothetical protein